jgi:hypothetical protein
LPLCNDDAKSVLQAIESNLEPELLFGDGSIVGSAYERKAYFNAIADEVCELHSLFRG